VATYLGGALIAFLARCRTFFGRLMQLLCSPKTQRWGNGPRALATYKKKWSKMAFKGHSNTQIDHKGSQTVFFDRFPSMQPEQLSPTSPKPRLEEPLHVAHTKLVSTHLQKGEKKQHKITKKAGQGRQQDGLKNTKMSTRRIFFIENGTLP